MDTTMAVLCTADPPEEDDPRLECGPDPWNVAAQLDWGTFDGRGSRWREHLAGRKQAKKIIRSSFGIVELFWCFWLSDGSSLMISSRLGADSCSDAKTSCPSLTGFVKTGRILGFEEGESGSVASVVSFGGV
ncbi:hypothetical protein CDAR_528451 [Caerostris darwini]|uniref:Uncharacterized protein n=1 Tax=Caerostris darwini TaxID=1538125 RepID=A0AAV4P6E7_9ARAC|nr:hypothetical protein CDAR_528451 [Caerostris darwini]